MKDLDKGRFLVCAVEGETLMYLTFDQRISDDADRDPGLLVKSASRPGVWYEVGRNAEGAVTCSCEAAVHGNECHHIRHLRQFAVGERSRVSDDRSGKDEPADRSAGERRESAC